MQISWHGLGCIRLQGKEVTIIMDPFAEKAGLKLPSFKADIVTLSSEDATDKKVSGQPFVIDIPGEYEMKGVFIYALPWRKQKSEENGLLFRVNIDNISIAHLGALDRVVPNVALEILEGCDILLLPVGDPNLLSPKDAVEVISRIEPRIVIPIVYKSKGVKITLQGPEAFYKELGATPEKVDKLKIQKKDLPVEERKVYQLAVS